MRARTSSVLALTVASLLPFTPGGCGGSLLEALPPSDGASFADALNQLTAGDLAEAFADFRNGLSDDAERGQFADLSDEQRSAIEQLQLQLDAGQISEQEFIDAVAELLQDTAPNTAFAGFRFLGSPFSAEGVNDFAELLGLTEEQQQQALLIYRALHGDIGDVRAAAREQIRALLSAQQQAILEQVAGELFDQAGILDEQREGAQLVFDVLALRLGLTVDQQAQIETIRAELRAAVEQLHAGARDQFFALLGDSQLDVLDLIERFLPGLADTGADGDDTDEDSGTGGSS